jgi:site-specific DNA-methyltransferase (adenine-specific)
VKPYYQDEFVTLYHSKCEAVLPTIAAASVDFVLTDPCYGTTQLDWDIPADWSTLWTELYRVSKSKALQVLFSAQPFTTDLIVSNRRRFRYELIWPKTMPTGFLDANRRPLRAHENVLVFADEFGGSTYNPQKVQTQNPSHPSSTRGRTDHYSRIGQTVPYVSTLERYPTTVLPAFSNGNGGVSDHETAKPIDLVSWLILTYTNPGDLVLDPFLGSGSTSDACKRLGRRCIGIEVREQPLQVARRRLYQESMQFDSAL